MSADTIGPFPPPPLPRPGDISPPAEGYTRGRAAPLPADGTIIAVTNYGSLTSYFRVARLREMGPLGWFVFAARVGSPRANFEIHGEPDGNVRVTGLRTGDELFRGQVTHEPISRFNQRLSLSGPGCIFYDLEG